MRKQQGLTFIETLISLALVGVCATLCIGAFMQLAINQSFMYKQNRALNIAQKAIAEAWSSGSCYSAQGIATSEGMTLTCTKVSYGARIELEWRLSTGKIEQIEIN